MNFKIESSGNEVIDCIGSIMTLPHVCRICGEYCLAHETVLSGGDRCKICRNCTKQLAKFIDDNRNAIISM